MPAGDIEEARCVHCYFSHDLRKFSRGNCDHETSSTAPKFVQVYETLADVHDVHNLVDDCHLQFTTPRPYQNGDKPVWRNGLG